LFDLPDNIFEASKYNNMNYRLLFLLCFFGAIASLSAQSAAYTAKVSPEVRGQLDAGYTTDVLVMMRTQADLAGVKQYIKKADKGQFVFSQLKTVAFETQRPVLDLLRLHQAYANSFYLVNAVAIEKADRSLIEALVQVGEVKTISSDPWVLAELPSEDQSTALGTATERGALEWGLEKINAQLVWALGYNGQGITVGGADTGYDWSHPGLTKHYRGYTDTLINHNYNWYDAVKDSSSLNQNANNPCGFAAAVPCDDNSHGTHTMGTMVGDDDLGNQTGVAPGAKWIGCRNMDRGWGRPSTYLGCFEWFLAPTDVTGNAPNPAKAPHVINNSWYCADIEGCDQPGTHEAMRLAIMNLKTAGVVVVISNGNEGSSCSSTGNPPAYFAESFSIGATMINDTIAGFSSRGPVTIDASNRLKPNVSAPGANVRSTVLNGGYASYSGTSMAGPHVAGLVALMLSANPDLAGHVDTIERMIEQTAVPLYDGEDCGGVPANTLPNNTHGFGRINALAAVQSALAWQSVAAHEPAAQSRITVQPTVVTTFCTIRSAVVGKADVQFFDASGRLLKEMTQVLASDAAWQIDLAQLPAGLVFYRIVIGETKASGVLIKE
jgi:serine protease AprX